MSLKKMSAGEAIVAKMGESLPKQKKVSDQERAEALEAKYGPDHESVKKFKKVRKRKED